MTPREYLEHALAGYEDEITRLTERVDDDALEIKKLREQVGNLEDQVYELREDAKNTEAQHLEELEDARKELSEMAYEKRMLENRLEGA